MTFTLPITAIEDSPRGEAPRRGDGSFEQDLEKAKVALEKKGSSAVWDRLQAIFSVMPLSFDFRMEDTSSSLKKGSPGDQPKRADNGPKEAQARGSEDNNPGRILFQSSDTRSIKEALVKLVPSTAVPVFVPVAFQGGANFSKVFSKGDMQLLIDQIVEQAKLMKTRQKTELSLMMSQEEMGSISLILSSRNGHVSVEIAAQAEMKKQLQDSISELENALSMAEIDIEEIRITEAANEQFFSGS